MRLLFTGYTQTSGFRSPQAWLERLSFYTGIHTALAATHTVCSVEHIGWSGSLLQGGVHYEFLPLGPVAQRLPVATHRFIRQWRPDAVLVNGFHQPAQLLQLRWALGPRPKLLVLHRADRPLHGFRRRLQQEVAKSVSGWLFTERAQAEPYRLARIITDDSRVHEVIQASSHFTPLDRAAARTALGVTGAPLCLWVGRLNANKDPLTVLRAFTRFQAERPGARLYVIHQSSELLPELQSFVARHPVARAAVQFIGPVPHTALQQWYAAADLLLSGSHAEGSGIVVAEAMSCGCIPLLTEIPSFRRMVGPLLPRYTPGDADGLYRLLADSRSWNFDVLRNEVLRRFRQELSFDAIAEQIDRILTG
ncbi:glycosyltransferase family 4 protein [Flaviaesturariibacter amylovorans]|uniref:Glycosyl transferase family 1 domain-containing protein n=1 Tax=Flaviaesturariibacter amylovorans TaxID=1084520 RepID=A0ABP8HEX1_9BACT